MKEREDTPREVLEIIVKSLNEQLHRAEAEVQKLREALKSIKDIKRVLTISVSVGGHQAVMPGLGPLSDLGPEDLVMHIVDSEERHWSIPEIIQKATNGGKDTTKYTNVYSVFYSAAKRLAGKGQLEMVKLNGRKPGEKKGVYVCKPTEIYESLGFESD